MRGLSLRFVCLSISATDSHQTSDFCECFPTAYLQRRYRSGVQNFSDVPGKPPQTFVHPEDGHWLKLPDGMIQMALTEPVAVVRVVLLVLQRTMQSTGSFPPREPYYVKLSYGYFRRGGRMSHMSVVRGLQTAVERGYLLRQRVGKQQWEYAIAWKE